MHVMWQSRMHIHMCNAGEVYWEPTSVIKNPATITNQQDISKDWYLVSLCLEKQVFAEVMTGYAVMQAVCMRKVIITPSFCIVH